MLNWCSRIHLFPEDPTYQGPGQEMDLTPVATGERLSYLQGRGVTTLICGALSPDLLQQGERLGLRIICGVAGEVGEVLRSYWQDRLDQPRFRLPGCRVGLYRQNLRELKCPEFKGHQGGKKAMPGGKGRGASRGQGGSGGGCRQTGGGPGRPGGGQSPGAADFCVCPACGGRAPHERGIPCLQINCPQCGKPMVRE
ncbi:MAG: hypothetical protein AB1424_15530 [Thermodesulfobacteriota bacterium]